MEISSRDIILDMVVMVLDVVVITGVHINGEGDMATAGGDVVGTCPSNVNLCFNVHSRSKVASVYGFFLPPHSIYTLRTESQR